MKYKVTARQAKDYLQKLEDGIKTDDKQFWKYMRRCGTIQRDIADVVVITKELLMIGKKQKPSINIFSHFFLPTDNVTYDKCSNTLSVIVIDSGAADNSLSKAACAHVVPAASRKTSDIAPSSSSLLTLGTGQVAPCSNKRLFSLQAVVYLHTQQ